MKIGLLFAAVLSLALTAPAYTQNEPAPPADAQSPAGGAGSGSWQGQHGGMAAGHSIVGTVTAVASGYYTITTDTGDVYTVHFNASTRILKQTVQRRDEGPGGNPPQVLRSTEVKAGDVIAAIGGVDVTAKSVSATRILELDPERVRQMREMQATYGKTWLMGKVTAINEVKVTLLGPVDNALHTFVADENTSFRKQREAITLGDVKVGDTVRVEGAVKDGIFVAATVSVLSMPPGGMPSVPRSAPLSSQPQY